jgi:hypothetical protein
MGSGFDPQLRDFMWVELFVCSLPCQKGFPPVFLPFSTFLNTNSISGDRLSNDLGVCYLSSRPWLSSRQKLLKLKYLHVSSGFRFSHHSILEDNTSYNMKETCVLSLSLLLLLIALCRHYKCSCQCMPWYSSAHCLSSFFIISHYIHNSNLWSIQHDITNFINNSDSSNPLIS